MASRIQLFANVGGSGDNFSGVIFDDEAAIAITSGAVPFRGRFKPQGSLSAFDGKNAAGTWTLEITDDTRQTGTLNNWSLSFSRAVAPAPPPPASPSNDLFLAAALDQLFAENTTITKPKRRVLT